VVLGEEQLSEMPVEGMEEFYVRNNLDWAVPWKA
jgi:hypothetical protein